MAQTVLLSIIFLLSLAESFGQEYPFMNPSLPWNERVNDLISRLTLEEMVLQLARGGVKQNGPAPPIPRLGVKPYSWNTECLRGDVQAPGWATSFPQALGLAATFSHQLVSRVANATATEVRAKHNYFISVENYDDHTGLSCFSPVINIMRHPLWGRNQATFSEHVQARKELVQHLEEMKAFDEGFALHWRAVWISSGTSYCSASNSGLGVGGLRKETYGEDPYLSGVLATAFVSGLQGDHPRYIKTNAGCKHFDAHGGPENVPVSRFSFDAQVLERDMQMTFLPQFHACVQAGTYSIMCSYNRVNGVPACANKRLLTDILRSEWGFEGYVVSDEGAIEFIMEQHNYTSSFLETAVEAVKAGCNLELSINLADNVFMKVQDAVMIGNITKETLKERLYPLFYTRMRLGEFDPPQMNPYSYLDLRSVQSQDHRDLAVEASIKSFVLLKNIKEILPLNLEGIRGKKLGVRHGSEQ